MTPPLTAAEAITLAIVAAIAWTAWAFIERNTRK